MTADAHAGTLQEPRGADPAGAAGKLCRLGRLLVGLSTIAVGLGCFFEPWSAHMPGPTLAILSFHAVAGAALGLVLIAAGAGIFAARRTGAWALIVGAAALLASIAGGVFPYRDIAATRDLLLRIVLVGAMMMLAGIERHRGGQLSRRFQVGRWVLAAGALLCVAAQSILSVWQQAGFDMFYFNYDEVTLFNSIWSWSYALGLIFGLLAIVGATTVFFPKLARTGAICLAGASILFLPLEFLYRLDDFCGGGWTLVELAYEWALDLGVAGGALIVMAGLGQAQREDKTKSLSAAAAFGVLFRPKWIRVAIASLAAVLLALIVAHGLIPFFFYEANSRGDTKLGDVATRLYAATYVPARGNSYWREKLTEGILSAGPAGRRCAAGDAEGCRIFGRFYFDLGWNWGRAWRFTAKAAALSPGRKPQP